MTPFLFACRNEEAKLNVIKFFVESGADLMEGSPLEYVCKRENVDIEIVKYLYNNGCQLNNNLIKNVLDSSMNINLLKFLIDYGCDINAVTDYTTPLQHYLSSCYTNENLDKFFKNHADTRYALNYITIRENINLETLTFFANENNNINHIMDNFTPLMNLCGSSQIDNEAIKILLDKGANPRIKNNRDVTALMVASINESLTLDILKTLVTNKECLEDVDSNGNSTLYYLTLGQIVTFDMMKYVMSFKPNINTQNAQGVSPLLGACMLNKEDVIKLFMDHNVDVNTKNNHGNTCLMFICMSNNMELIKLFLEKGADINALDNDKDNAFSYACGCDNRGQINLDIIKHLVEQGADYMNISNDGDTPIMYACGDHSLRKYMEVNVEVIKYLIDLGIDKNYKNKDGKHYLDFLIENDIDFSIIGELISSGYLDTNDPEFIRIAYLKNLSNFIEMIHKNETDKHTGAKSDMCIICHGEWETNDKFIKCKNSHELHKDCILKWIRASSNTKCPMCKESMIFDGVTYIKI